MFNNWPKITMISWEATITHGLPLSDFKALMKYQNPRSQFLGNVTKHSIHFFEEKFKAQLSYAADPLVMAVMLEPDIVTESVEKCVQIERFGWLSRGMTVIDWWGNSEHLPNAKIV